MIHITRTHQTPTANLIETTRGLAFRSQAIQFAMTKKAQGESEENGATGNGGGDRGGKSGRGGGGGRGGRGGARTGTGPAPAKQVTVEA